MEPHWRVLCVLEGCEGRIVWRPGQPSRWLDEHARLQRGQIQDGWCEACSAHYEQRSTQYRHHAVADVLGRWERVPFRENCVLRPMPSAAQPGSPLCVLSTSPIAAFPLHAGPSPPSLVARHAPEPARPVATEQGAEWRAAERSDLVVARVGW